MQFSIAGGISNTSDVDEPNKNKLIGVDYLEMKALKDNISVQTTWDNRQNYFSVSWCVIFIGTFIFKDP